MNNVFTFVFLMVTAVLCFNLAETYLKHRRKKTDNDGELEETLEEIKKLEERIQVLERIVTENRYDLKQEIDSL